jgi:cell division cycle 2-like
MNKIEINKNGNLEEVKKEEGVDVQNEQEEKIEILGKRTSREDDREEDFGKEGGIEVKKKLRPRLGGLEGCRSIENFKYLNKIDEGSYGIVFRGEDLETGEIVAIKKVKLEKEKEGFPITSLREITIMTEFNHTNIVKVKEIVYGSTLDKIYVVMEFIDYELKTLLESKMRVGKSERDFLSFSHGQIKYLLKQLLQAVAYMHKKWIIHRDLKTSNLLLSKDGVLKVCDFGMARKYGNPLRPYTHLVVTLWYRAPEILLGSHIYSPAIDLWSVGCIFAELLLREPLLNGKNELDQIQKIFRLIGMPNEQTYPGWNKLKGVRVLKLNKKLTHNRLREKFPKVALPGDMFLSDLGVNFMNQMLKINPEERITAEEALKHPWFEEEPKLDPNITIGDISSESTFIMKKRYYCVN